MMTELASDDLFPQLVGASMGKQDVSYRGLPQWTLDWEMPLLLSDGRGSHLQFPREPELYHSKLDQERRKMLGTFDYE